MSQLQKLRSFGWTKALIPFEIRKNCLISGRGLLLYQLKKGVIQSDCSNYLGITLLSTSYKILSNIFL
jgi:hypothetical protein